MQLEAAQQRLEDVLAQQAAVRSDADGTRAAASAATERAAAAEAAAAAATAEAAVRRAAADEAACAAEAVRVEAEGRVERAERAAREAADALTVKRAMVENSSEQIAELKVELEDATQCAPSPCCAHHFRLLRCALVACLMWMLNSARGMQGRGRRAGGSKGGARAA